MINYANEEVIYEGCPGCAYANHEFELPCEMAYENDDFTLAQDWELPIEGFYIVSPKRHIEKLSELTTEERIEMFDIVDKTIKILRKNNVCDEFNMIFEEKENRHFHVWIMPRHKWMENLGGSITHNIGAIFDYAKSNLRSEETNENIKNITKILKENFYLENLKTKKLTNKRNDKKNLFDK